ncbi:MAG TPA: histidine kinase [Actinomycetota bacterium]
MRVRGAAWLAWSMCAVAAAAIAGSVAVHVAASTLALDSVGVLPVLAFSVVGALIAGRRPENAVGWILGAVGLSFAIATFAGEYSTYSLRSDPGALPADDLMAWVAVWAWPPGIILVFTYLFLLFPDGRLPSHRWRPVAWLGAVAAVMTVVPIALAAWPIRGPILTMITDVAPAGASDAFKLAYDIQVAGVLLMFGLGIVSAASLVFRFRRASGDEREQLKWFAYAAGFLVAAIIANSPLFDVGGNLLPLIALAVVPVAIGIAMLKYRLYDIDVVINKTVVVAVLAAFVTAVYLAIVVGIGAVVGSAGQPNLLLSIAATAIVAIAFQPLRERARRLADRVVYGRRATPYEVLSEFSERVAGAYSTDEVLPRMAQVLGEGTGATQSRVWLRVGDRLRLAASWPNGPATETTIPMPGDDLPELPGADRSVAVRHRSELLGALTLTKPPSEPVTPAEEKLLSDLASQAGLMLRNVRLTTELQERLADLRASRQRLVAAQDEERRKIERNIHDGAQQELVALAVKMRIAENAARREAAPETGAMLSDLQLDAAEALENLRDLARGIYPPLLADQGLTAAIEAQARKAPIPVVVDSPDIGRYAKEIESAVYFCVLEALQNVGKYARASEATISLAEEEPHLVFRVTDDGLGFDTRATIRGTGLQGMVDRLDPLDGTLEVRSAPGEGTTIVGRIPVA